eukprot:gene24726-10363_t
MAFRQLSAPFSNSPPPHPTCAISTSSRPIGIKTAAAEINSHRVVAQPSFVCEVAQVDVHSPANLDLTKYSVQDLNSKQITRLLFSVPPVSENLLTGRLLQGGDAITNSTIIGDGDDGNAIVIVDPSVPIVVTGRGSSRDFTPIDGVVPISTIVFILKAAGKASTISLQSLKSRWLNKDNAQGSNQFVTMENYFKFCSYGKTMMDSNNEVVDLRSFDIPQSGNMGGNLSKYTRRIVVMPPNRCFFYGAAHQGCFGEYCYVWIRQDSGQVIEYGDASCAMGSTYDRGAGWALPIATLTKANLTAGAWRDYNIPSTRQTDRNFVRVFPDWDTPSLGWVGKQFPGYYFSYRTRDNYDAGLRTSYTNRYTG